MHQRRRFFYKILVIGLVAAMLLAALVLTKRGGDAPLTNAPPSAGAQATPPDSPGPASESPAEAPPAVETRRASLPALPDNSLPLAAQLPILLERADAGDPVSSCRLIVGLNRCREYQRNRLYTEKMVQHLQQKARENEGALIDFAAQMQERGQGAAAFCAEAQTQSLPTPDQLLEQAKARLSPRQKAILVLMRSDGSLRRLRGRVSFTESGLYVLPQFIAENSQLFLMQGYAAKDALALEGLVLLHAPASAIAPSSVSVWLPNPRLFLKYSMLMYELFGAEAVGQSAMELMQISAASVGADELQRIRDWVRAEAEQWRRTPDFQAPRPEPVKSSDGTDLGQCDQ